MGGVCVDNETKEILQLILKGQEELKQEISGVKKEVSSVKEEVASVKQEVASVKREVANVKQEVEGLKQITSNISQRVIKIEAVQEYEIKWLDKIDQQIQPRKMAN